MLAVFAVGLSLAAGPCRAVARLDTPALELRLERATLSPPSLRRAERACLAAAASQRLDRYPKGPLSSAVTPALVQALDVIQPGVAPVLALGRSDLFADLADQLHAMCAQDDAPKACASSKSAKAAPWPQPIDQSRQGFSLWLRVEPGRAAQARRLEAFLRKRKLAGIAPTYQLLRTASDWQVCGGEPFALPPPDTWPHAAKSLAWIKGRVEPAIGAVEFVSSYREPALNACAQGAKESAHLDFWALDLEPLDPTITRADLMQTLCAVHKQYGQSADIGLGFYAGVRFHIDSKRYRHWGFDPVAAPACAVTAPNAPPQSGGAVTE